MSLSGDRILRLFALSALLLPCPLLAETADAPSLARGPRLDPIAEVRPLLGIGFNQGDDELTIPHHTVLGQGESIYTNGGAYVQVGALFYRESDRASPRRYGIRVTAGYQYDSSHGTNSDAKFYVVPFEMIPFLETERARYGVGFAYHVEPRFNATGEISHLDQRFDDALGIVMQAEWRLHPRFSVGVRYSLIEYHAASQETEIKGNTAGVIFSLTR